MWSRAKYILLPVFGALAAMLSFYLASPYEASLAHQGLAAGDPAAHFTYGTMWGEVNRIAFGTALCGSFCFLLTAGRQAWWKVLRSTIVGALLGGTVNYVTDSGSDLIGIALSHANGIVGELVAGAAWSALVPAGIAFTVSFSIGPTKERLRRAVVATFVAAFACLIAQTFVGLFTQPQIMKQGLDGLVSPTGEINLAAMLPAWRTEAIAVGIALGFTMIVADQWSRAGTLRLLLGRNEFRDWSLDHSVNRMGSSEGLEIPVWGFRQVAARHAQIVRSGLNFVFESLGPPALVNGQAVSSATLSHGDILTLGDATFVFLGRGLPRPAPVQRRDWVPQAHQGFAPPPQTSNAQVPMRFLVDGSGGKYSLAPGVYEVGRDATAAISLPSDSTVSRHHASISVTPQGSQVVDLGSSNGTKVNGVCVVSPTPLNPGDTIEFGSARFHFR